MREMKECSGGSGIQLPHEETVDSRVGARFLGVHYKTIEQMARMGQVPATKFGKSWRFLPSLLGEWRKEQMKSNLNKNPEPKNKKENEND
jgi:excisionase family DNA binding protein